MMSTHEGKILGIITIFAVSVGLIAMAIQILHTENFVEADLIEVHGTTMLIGRNCTAIVGSVSFERASYVQLGLEGETADRPNVYDVFKDAIGNFNITLEEVRVHNVKDGAYLADGVFSSDRKDLVIDGRPSDLIALALRTESPVYINKTLLSENGEQVC